MKKIKYITLMIIGTFLVLNSCDESLDLQPHKPSMQQFFNNEATFKRSIYGVYAKMPDLFAINGGTPLYGLWYSPGDDVNAFRNYSFNTFEAISADLSPLNSFFDTSYELISRANLVIEKANENIDQFSGEEKEEVNKIKGEALFLRSYWYFKLWQYYGSYIPLIEYRKELGGDVSLDDLRYPSAGSDNEVLDFCISNLQEAAEVLPEEWPADQNGRVTNDAAYGLLGKVYMFRACYNDANQEDYQNAINAFEQIDTHNLVPHYGYNFDVTKENNEESLFEFQASVAPDYEWVWNDNDYDVGHGHMSAHYAYYTNMWNIKNWGEGDFGLLLPTKKLVSAFDTAASARDPRVDEIFVVNQEDPWNGYQFVKYIKRQDDTGYKSYASTNNYRMLRMGDVLLLKAEALLQTGDSPGALDLVNQIRERARNSVADGEPASTAPADFTSIDMQKIIDERFRELAAEGHRWGDLKRWDAAGYIDLASWGKDEFSAEHDVFFEYPKNLLFPIPLNETEQNPNITQNPDY